MAHHNKRRLVSGISRRYTGTIMASLEKRMDAVEVRLEHVIGVLDRVATNQAELDKVMATLADAYIRSQEQYSVTQEQFRETDRRLRETDALLQETIRESRANKLEAEARARELDARIDKLVSGIGEFIRRSDAKPN